MGPTWRWIAESLRGPSHESEDQPCQDANSACLLGEGDQACLVACVADGAGSAPHSDLGAAEACRAVVEQATAYHTEHGGFATLDADDALEFVRHAHERVLALAQERGCTARDFASTLLVAIAAPERTCVFQIGDGAIILGQRGVYGVAFWPQSGEYANTTNFLTAEQFDEHVEFAAAPGTIDNLALLTDGLERLALTFETMTPHTPFCAPLFEGLRTCNDLDQLATDLVDFLDSESVRQRSDDDKSLILASRAHANGHEAS